MSNEAVAQQTATDNEVIGPEMYRKIDAIIEKYKDKPGSLIPVLQQAQTSAAICRTSCSAMSRKG